MLVTAYFFPITTIRPGVTAAKSGCATGTRVPSLNRNTKGRVSQCNRSRMVFVFNIWSSVAAVTPWRKDADVGALCGKPAAATQRDHGIFKYARTSREGVGFQHGRAPLRVPSCTREPLRSDCGSPVTIFRPCGMRGVVSGRYLIGTFAEISHRSTRPPKIRSGSCHIAQTARTSVDRGRRFATNPAVRTLASTTCRCRHQTRRERARSGQDAWQRGRSNRAESAVPRPDPRAASGTRRRNPGPVRAARDKMDS